MEEKKAKVGMGASLIIGVVFSIIGVIFLPIGIIFLIIGILFLILMLKKKKDAQKLLDNIYG